MRPFRAILVTVTILILLVSWPRHYPAQNPSTPTPQAAKGNLSAEGTVTNAEGSPVKNAKVTITSGHIIREAVSDKDGKISIKDLSPGTADVSYEAPGYDRLEEHGLPLAKGMDLSKILQEKGPDSRWALLLLIPAVLGLSCCALRDLYNRRKQQALARVGDGETPPSSPQPDIHFGIAAIGGWIWLITFLLWVLVGRNGTISVDTLYLFHSSLPVELYVPVLGFVGALLFVLDIRRRYGGEEPTINPGGEELTNNSEEEIPKGKEFGMRIFMGPYVAIVVVVLLGKGLTSPQAKGALAFFSGLLVVMALQGLVEKGQKVLGEWRKGANFKIFEARKQELEKVIGNVVWARLRQAGVNTVEEFAHLDDLALDQLAVLDPKLLKENLKTLRDRAKEIAMAA